jgi:hypothetical protein
VALAVLALGAMPVGFLLFLPTWWIQTHWRVYFHSSIGAAVVVAVALEGLAARAGRRRAGLAAGAGILVAAALAASLAQHRAYAERSLAQQRQVAPIVRDAPGLAGGTLVLLLDRPPYRGRPAWTPPCALATECLTVILRYVHGRQDVDAVFCSPGYQPPSVRHETCRFERGELVVSYRDPWGPDTVTRRTPYDRLVVWESAAGGVRLLTELTADHPDGGTPEYRPRARMGTAAPLPPRVRTAFSRWPP